MKQDNGNHAATPGPWRITGQTRFGGRQKTIVGGPAQIDVAEACGPTSEITDANARLIAAAPELLQALELAEATVKRLSRQRGPFNSADGTQDVIRAAIAKAKGD